jgi:hypothetical protein
MFIMGDKHELQQLQLHLNQFVYLLTSIVICLSAYIHCHLFTIKLVTLL